ncbi:MAG TPA: carbohydrate-binding protein, partial [Chitinophagaceae bacterium]|nr:carbohydrate-binding protein [Chitinophagaceae bacterium]
SDNAKLVRIEYNAGNRTPIVEASASTNGGTVPLTITLSSAGTKDYDGDSLKYDWSVTPSAGGAAQTFNTANPSVTLSQPGEYKATLTVTDPSGAKNSKSLVIVAGNEPPKVALTLSGNKTFFFPGKPFNYAVAVSDKEDGKIDPKQVAVSIDYVSDGFDLAEIKQQQSSVDASTQFAVAQALIKTSDCNNCHHLDTKSVGPMFTQIADKYKGQIAWALDSLPKKVRGGGVGVWGDVSMPAHPGLSLTDARAIVNYILHSTEKTISTLPLSGSYTQKLSPTDDGKGLLIVRAAYTDKGAAPVPALTTENTIVLHSPQLSAGAADIKKDVQTKMQAMFNVSLNVEPKNGGYIGYKGIDLTGIKQLGVTATANPSQGFSGGTIEAHLDQPDGELLGTVQVAAVNPLAALMSAANAAQNNGGGNKPGAAAKPGAPAPAAGKQPAAPQKQRQGGINMAAIARLMAGMAKKMTIKDVTGQHDVYFVFKNDKANPNGPLMSVSSVQFNDAIVPDPPMPKF